MKWKFLNVPLGVNAPSGTLAKCADVAAAANIAGNFLNFIGQMDANNINATQSERWRNTTIEQNRLNRDWQSAENRAAEAWQEKMWNLQNAYNTPSAIRQRLQEAGYNPWISGSGGGNLQSLAGSAGQGHSGSASQLPLGSPIPAQNAFGGLSGLAQSFGIDAQIANQNAKTMMELIQVYDKARESGMSHDDAVSMISPMLNAIGGLSKEMNYTLEGRKVQYEKVKLDNDYQTLQNDIFSKYGKKEAESRIANIEMLTTKYVGELGLMSSQADRNRSEIQLNEKRAYELGARAASEFAQAGLFTSEASINNGIINYLIGNARLSYVSNAMNTTEQYAGFIGDTGKREYIMSEEGQKRRTWNYKQSPEGNYVSSFMKGFVDNSNTSFNFGGNYNYSRSFGNNRNYSNSWIWNGDNYYPHR